MEPVPPKNRPRHRLFPTSLKSFVGDMKTFRDLHIHRHRRGMRSEQLQPKEAWLPASPDPFTSTSRSRECDQFQVAQPQLAAREHVATSSTSRLTVHLTLSFAEPLSYAYSRHYDASPSLCPTDRLCEGILRHIDHCSQELITRKDSGALDRTSAADGSAKPRRYEIQVRVVRDSSETWSARTFTSFQRQPLNAEGAREVILSTHRMVGVFLRRHDEGFVWKDGPVRDDVAREDETFPYRPGRVQPMSCIPRSLFLEKSQTFELRPGYSVVLSFTSRNSRLKPPEWSDTVQVDSKLETPLTLAGAESLLFEASFAMESVFRSERRAFEHQHRPCNASDGCKQCHPRQGDGVEMKLTVANNLGPQYGHLSRVIRTETSLFSHPQARDCIEFLDKMKTSFAQVRDDADNNLSRINDLEFRVTELRGRGWALEEPLLFTLKPDNCESRTRIEAILDRVQTGVAGILRGNAIAVRMTAYKRGHFILDKTLVAREPIEKMDGKRKSPLKAQALVVNRVQHRIKQDFDMMCRDTCSIDDLGRNASSEDLCRTKEISPRTSNKRSAQDSLRTSPTPDQSEPVFKRNGSEESSALSRTPTLVRRRAPTFWDPRTGGRRFPLAPGVKDGSSADDGSPEYKVERKARRQLFNPSKSDILQTKVSIPQTAPDLLTEVRLWPTTGFASAPDAKSEEDADKSCEASTAPPTPSLVYGGNSSPRSSLLITPRAFGSSSSADIEAFKYAAGDSDFEDDRESQKSPRGRQPKMLQTLPEMSPTVQNNVLKITPSPLQQDQSVQEPTGLGIVDSDRSSTCGRKSDAVERDLGMVPSDMAQEVTHKLENAATRRNRNTPDLHPEHASRGAEADQTRDDDDTPQPTSSSKEDIANQREDMIAATTYLQPLSAVQSREAEDFSQSRAEFSFSSPSAITTEGGNSISSSPTDGRFPTVAAVVAGGKIESASPRDVEDVVPVFQSPDPSEAEDVGSDGGFGFGGGGGDLFPPQPRPALTRPSFGSAGYLGFGGGRRLSGVVDLRRALTGAPSPPLSVAGDGPPYEERRPGTAM
ncbi:hypothetical protein GGR56DRAFT_206221 [Xylariaceae sp. FL0804]|nr:hypothetical protein GGR56DRAFT_206221 [Xylariaceae sp. FL0804]